MAKTKEYEFVSYNAPTHLSQKQIDTLVPIFYDELMRRLNEDPTYFDFLKQKSEELIAQNLTHDQIRASKKEATNGSNH